MDRRLLSSWGMYNWLISGSLLGWYRQCGAIPYTSDADTASWASNFKPWMKDYFLGPDKGTCVCIHRNTITILSNVLKFKIITLKRMVHDGMCVKKLPKPFQTCFWSVIGPYAEKWTYQYIFPPPCHPATQRDMTLPQDIFRCVLASL